MFIRATKTHSARGQPGFSFRLVRSRRCGAAVRQKTLLNLGTDYPVPRSHWPEVTRLAEDLLAGQDPLLTAPAEVLAAAEDLVRRLRAHGFAVSQPGDSPTARVRLDSLQHAAPRSVGGERLCLHGLQQPQFPDLLRQAGASARDAAIGQRPAGRPHATSLLRA